MRRDGGILKIRITESFISFYFLFVQILCTSHISVRDTALSDVPSCFIGSASSHGRHILQVLHRQELELYQFCW